MNEQHKVWCLGFFEGQSSFAVNIGLTKTKNRRYVIFKPIINIANPDYVQVEFIKKILELSFSNTKKKEGYKSIYTKTFSLGIQNFEDIDKVVDLLSEYVFKSPTKQKKLDKFIKCYEDIKEMGYIHTEWDDKFLDIIEQKLNINNNRSNINNNRYSSEDWLRKIKEHLKGVEK